MYSIISIPWKNFFWRLEPPLIWNGLSPDIYLHYYTVNFLHISWLISDFAMTFPFKIYVFHLLAHVLW